jgi:SpoVK/Ycf46/Vps4 family AAA+-type ATPase
MAKRKLEYNCDCDYCLETESESETEDSTKIPETIQDLIKMGDKRREKDLKNLTKYIKNRVSDYILEHDEEPDSDTLTSFYDDYEYDMISVRLSNIQLPLKKLDDMIGMKSIKNSIIDFVLYHIQDFSSSTDYLNMVITGAPGCGKSTVAEFIADIYAGIGILKKSKVVYISRADLIGKYLGTSAIKTKDKLTECIGSVVFIDEAYSLAPNDTDRDSFAKEVIDTLNQFLSEHKHEFVCIIAGYKDDLDKTFFAMNKGLERRFPWRFDIEPYTPEELTSIVKKNIKDMEWTLDNEVSDEWLEKLFKDNSKYFKHYGGDIETFLTKCRFAHVRRVFIKGEKRTFTKDDISKGLEKHIANYKKDDEDDFAIPPLGMYS